MTMLLALVVSLCVPFVPAATIYAAAVPADGTYTFGGAVTPSSEAGFKNVGTMWRVNNAIEQEGTVLYDSAGTPGSTGSLTLKVQPGTLRSFNFNNLSISPTASGFYMTSISIQLRDSNGGVVRNIVSSFSQAKQIPTGITPLSNFINGSSGFNVPNTSEVYVTWQLADNRPAVDISFESITISNALGPASVNADLSNLTISAGTLNPSFSSAQTAYSANVGSGVSSLTVTPTVADSKATVTVNGQAATSGSGTAVSLNPGSNTITVRVRAEDTAVTKPYTITVTRAIASTNANLSNLSLSSGTLSPGFSSAQITYSADVGSGVSSLMVTPTVADSKATVTVNGQASTSGSGTAVSLNPGSNTITVLVRAEDTAVTKTYTITVTRAIMSSNADLGNLTISSGTLTPGFASGTYNYDVAVGNAVASVNVTPSAAHSGATLTVNGTTVASGTASASIPLQIGPNNTITIVVTAEDGTTKKTYAIQVTRAKNSDATLSNLTISSGTLTPGFASGTEGYEATVGNEVGSLTVTPTVTHSGATVTVNGTVVTSGNASGAISLSVGLKTLVTIVITAEDGLTTKTYTLQVTREKSSNALLSSLTLTGGTLNETFAGTKTDYTATVGHEVASVKVTPTVAAVNSTVSVEDVDVTSGTSSADLPLKVGLNEITVIVTAEDGTTKTYTIQVTRAKSSDATLSNLTTTAGTWNKTFASGTEDYEVTVENAVASLSVTPTVAHSGAKVTVNGTPVTSGSASEAISLSVGVTTTIAVVVTAEDGIATKTYTLKVTREKSKDATLSNLTTSAGTWSEAFSSGTGDYEVTVENAVASVSVTPTVAHSGAKVTVNGAPVTSGSASEAISLSVGATTTIAVDVTAEDGIATKTYTLKVTREKSKDAT
ncbi:cadherin-like beta sandwich domain-containing protein, partial [Paenibacillus xanthanilyticus]